MEITVKVATEVDLDEVYSLCRPRSRKLCLSFIRKEVGFLLRMRAKDDGWAYPDEEYLAGRLCEEGLAETC